MKKTLGQHFLTNTRIHEQIVEAAEIKAGELVVEIGPGSGLLTDHILKAGARVIAIEKDRDLIAPLREKYKNQDIEIIEADVLLYKPTLEKYKLVGNLPFYLTSHLLRVVLQTWPKPEIIVFMVQKEVAQRMLAKPPDMNMLAVLVQYYTVPELITYVKRGNFSPPPKVDSAVVKFVPRNIHDHGLLAIAARGFSQPRKKLSNNIERELLEKAGIDPSRRAETLSLEEWQNITNSSEQ